MTTSTASPFFCLVFASTFTCGSPIVSHGRVFIGTHVASSDDDILLCLDEQTGREVGRFICRRPPGRGEHWGVCSTPTVEGDRLYLVTPYGEAVCVNLASWLMSQAPGLHRRD